MEKFSKESNYSKRENSFSLEHKKAIVWSCLKANDRLCQWFFNIFALQTILRISGKLGTLFLEKNACTVYTSSNFIQNSRVFTGFLKSIHGPQVKRR